MSIMKTVAEIWIAELSEEVMVIWKKNDQKQYVLK